MATRRLELVFTGDTNALERSFRRVDSTASRADRSLSRMSTGLKRLGGAAVVAGGALVGLGAGLGLREAIDAERVMARTENVIKTTGGAANVTAKQVQDLASSLQRQTGTADDAIQSAANMLLTFTKVRNEAGAGNDVFNQSVAAANDMSVAMGTDASRAALQLGKALNDPIKGVTALSRSGVSFTKEQKEQIATLVESGRTLEAQKIILREVQTEFGGAASAEGATTEAWQRLQRTGENLAESVMVNVLPAVNRFVTFAEREIIPVIGRVAAWVQRNWPTIRETTVAVFAAVRRAIGQAIAWIEANVVPTIRAVVGAARRFWDRFGDDVLTVMRLVMRNVQRAMVVIREVIAGVLAVLRGDWGRAWQALRTIVSTVFGGIVDTIRTLSRAAVSAALKLAAGMVRAIGNKLKDVGSAIRSGVVTGLGRLGDLAGAMVNKGLELGRKLIDGIVDAIKGAPGRIGSALSSIMPDPGGGVPFVPGIAGGGIIRGQYVGVDTMLAAVAAGERIVTPQAAARIPGGMSAIDAAILGTGGRYIGGAATGGIVGGAVQAAYQRATSNLGEPYGKPSRGESRTGPNSWDCSGFATMVAGVNVGGTTASAYTSSSPVRDHSRYPIVWGFRKQHGGGYRGGYDEHMGVRVGGVWFQTSGGQTARTGSDGDWQEIRVPRGLEGLAGADGDGGPVGESAAGRPQLTPLQALTRIIGRSGLARDNTKRAGAIARRILGTGTDSFGSTAENTPGSSLSDRESRGVGSAGRRARAEARAAGKSPDEVVEAGQEAERAAEVKVLKLHVRGIDTKRRKLRRQKQKLLDDLADLQRAKPTTPGAKQAAARRIRAAIAAVTRELNELLEVRAETMARLAELREEADQEAYDEAYDASGAGTAEDPPTAMDYAEADLARAALTPGTDDDLAAARRIEDLARQDLAAAEASGDPRRVRDAAQALANATAQREQIEATNANTDALNANTKAMQSFGGSVAFSSRGQEYVLGRGASPSSDRLESIGLGV